VLDAEIFTHGRHWPRLASAHHKPGRGSPQNLRVKIGLNILHTSAYNFGGSGRNLTKLYQGRWLEAWVITLYTDFTRGAPYTIWEGKNVQNSARF